MYVLMGPHWRNQRGGRKNKTECNEKTIVFYDPEDPSNSCTRFGKRQDNGMNYIIALLCVFGFFALIMLVILLFGMFTRW